MKPKKQQIKKKNTNISKKKIKGNKVVSKKSKRRGIKIRFGRVFAWIILPLLFVVTCISLIDFPIKNIFVTGNSILTDQEIIELASLEDYPSLFKYSSSEIKRKLKSNIYIQDVKIKKRKMREIYIEVTENKPLFYYEYTSKTVFSNGQEVNDNLSNTILLNYVPDTYYNAFVKSLNEMDESIRIRISEIKYVPNDVDDERFIFSMNDGNYVYINLSKIKTMNSYLDIIKNFDEKTGILYLDSGEYFEILGN